MSPSVEHLFGKLKCSEESTQNEAIAQLAMLLEKNTYTTREDPTWRMVLTDELLQLHLSPQEVKEVLREAISLADSRELYRSSRMSLIGVVTINATVEDAKAVLRYFLEFADSFNEAEAYSFLAEFTEFLLGIEDTSRIQGLITEWKTMELLEAIRRKGSERLQESASRVINHLRKPKQT